MINQAFRIRLAAAALLLAVPATVHGQDRDTKVRDDRDAFRTIDAWVYNDLDAAFEQARLSKKPILAVLRCVP